VSSYNILWDKKLNGKVGWFDWYLPSMGNLSQYLGHHKTPFDISNDDFDKLKSTLFSLKGQSSGFYAMADVFSSLSNGDAWVIPGVGAWVATLLQLQGHPVAATIPKEGGLQWTESVSIFKNARNPDLAVKYIQYLTTPEGQVKEATLPAYSAAIPSRTGWALLTKQKPTWANRLGLNPKRHPNVIDQFRAGDIALRDLPKRQSIEDWNGAWTQFKNK
jgi:spermidine/putrescine transport system substrate-binding protein